MHKHKVKANKEKEKKDIPVAVRTGKWHLQMQSRYQVWSSAVILCLSMRFEEIEEWYVFVCFCSLFLSLHRPMLFVPDVACWFDFFYEREMIL